MMLIWSTKDIKDFEELDLKGTTEMLIYATMTLKINKITLDNISEWLFRSHLMLQTGVATFTRGIEPSAFTREELFRHVGLWTNAETATRAQFRNALIKSLERRVNDTIKEIDYKSRAPALRLVS